MLMTRGPLAAFGQRHPAEGCAEFPLLLLDEQWAELQQKARSRQRTIGQMIREALGRYLADEGDRGDAEGWHGDDHPDLTDGHGVVAVTLLLPLSLLAALEALAARRASTTTAVIRRVVCATLIGCQSGRQLLNEP